MISLDKERQHFSFKVTSNLIFFVHIKLNKVKQICFTLNKVIKHTKLKELVGYGTHLQDGELKGSRPDQKHKT